MSAERQIPVVEIFGPTIQGEGQHVGEQTVFIRTGGCDDRCKWCDSLHAVLPEYASKWERLTASQIVDRVADLSPPPILITISGGNPAIHDLEDLLIELRTAGYRTTLETQGTRRAKWFPLLTSITFSPKPPSSGNATDPEAFAQVLHDTLLQGSFARQNVCVKVVIGDEVEDLCYLLKLHELLKSRDLALLVEWYAQPLNPMPPGMNGPEPTTDEIYTMIRQRTRYLVDRIANHYPELRRVRIVPQLHVLLYGNKQAV